MRGVKNKHRRQIYMLYCVQGSHSHSLYLIYALLSRNQPCRVYALFGGHFWPKIWWEGAQKHFIQPGSLHQVQMALVCDYKFYLAQFPHWSPGSGDHSSICGSRENGGTQCGDIIRQVLYIHFTCCWNKWTLALFLC